MNTRFHTRLNSFGQKPVCVSVGAVPSPLKVFATNKTDVHIDPISSSVMKRMSFAYARMNHSLRAAYLITLTFGECKNYLERETLQSFSKSKSRTLLKGVFSTKVCYISQCKESFQELYISIYRNSSKFILPKFKSN